MALREWQILFKSGSHFFFAPTATYAINMHTVRYYEQTHDTVTFYTLGASGYASGYDYHEVRCKTKEEADDIMNALKAVLLKDYFLLTDGSKILISTGIKLLRFCAFQPSSFMESRNSSVSVAL